MTKKGAWTQWTFGPNSAKGSIETTTIGKTHPTLEKRVALPKTRSKKNDGFSSSSGDFDKHAEIIIERQRVFKLRNQIRRIRKEHSIEIIAKDERIAELENAIRKLEKDSIKFEDLKTKLEEVQDDNLDLVDELSKTKLRFAAFQDESDRMKCQIEAQNLKIRISEEEIKKKDKQLKLKWSEIEELKNELIEITIINCRNELSDHGSDSLEQSQETYNTLVARSTEKFENKHLVPRYLSTQRHQYAQNLDFWNFDNSPLETQILNYDDSNFIGEMKLIPISIKLNLSIQRF